MGRIVPIWKRKGDVHDPGNYRGITLLSQVLKLLEMVLDAITVLDLISRKTVMKDAMKKLLNADDLALALVANGKQEIQETLEEWNGLFTRHGLNINLEKKP